MIEINLRKIKDAEHDYQVTEVPLQTESGIAFNLHVVSGFMNTNEINRRAWNNPILVTLPMIVKTEKGEFRSNSPVATLFAHGFRDQQKQHVVLSQGIDSQELVRAIVQHLESNNSDRLKVLISCDTSVDGVKTRWDQGTIGRQLGVMGFSGSKNIARTEAATKSIIVTVDENMGPHAFRHDSGSAWMRSETFTFHPKGGKLVIKAEDITSTDSQSS